MISDNTCRYRLIRLMNSFFFSSLFLLGSFCGRREVSGQKLKIDCYAAASKQTYNLANSANKTIFLAENVQVRRALLKMLGWSRYRVG
jgi:hypothetical protein